MTVDGGSQLGEGQGGAPSTQTDVEDLLVFLPVAAAESLATHLTPDDAATLRHLHRKSIPDNTLRAIASDLAYLEAWHLAATGVHLSWPAGEDVILKFLAHHLFDAAEREKDTNHGMPEAIETALADAGKLQIALPHAPSTVRRRLSHWKKLHIARDLNHAFESNPVRTALTVAVKASDRLKVPKSQKAITLDVLEKLLETCERSRVIDLRDKAMLLLAFGSGGRRRAEVSALRLEDVSPSLNEAAREIDVPYEIKLRRTKTHTPQDGEVIYVAGRAARALEAWAACMRRWKVDTSQGPLFRRVDRWSNVWEDGVSDSMLNTVIKQRLKLAGLKPKDYSAHGIRSGFMTEARNQGVPLEEAMAHSKHRSYQVASSYYKAGDARASKALKIAGD